MGIISRIKDAVLGRNKTYQTEIDKCVEELEKLLEINLTNGTYGEFLEGIQNAFSLVFGNETIYGEIDKGKKKGFDGFVDYVSGLIVGKSFDWRKFNYDSDILLKILKNVKRYRAPRSRVNALIGPCEKLYKKYMSYIAADHKLEVRVGSYFDIFCGYLLKASKADKGDTFWAYIVRAFNNLRFVAEFESKQGSTTFGKWYENCGSKIKMPDCFPVEEKYVACPDVLRAILNMNDKQYQGNGGFWKWLRKGGTKMQRASKLIKAVEKRAEELGLIKDGKVIGEK